MKLKRVKAKKRLTTYMPVLIKLIQVTKGPVLELGAGLFSTPLLHWLCAEEGRRLVTYEDVEQYYQFTKEFRSKNHSIHFVENWDKIDINRYWAVVLIDHAADRREKDILRLKDKADYIAIHDTEKKGIYGYEKIWSHFKYIYHWQFCQPWTSVVSNFKDPNRIL